MPENQHVPKKRYPAPLITFLILVLVGILYLAWNYFAGTLPWQQDEEVGSPKISWLGKEPEEKEIVEQIEISPPEEEGQTTLDITSGDTKHTPASPDEECRQTADKIQHFFEHLDNQSYIYRYTLKDSSLDHFRGIINKLMANPPIVVRETDDLFAILNNMAHFFRVLGPKDILLIKDVLNHEQELVEPTMALFYKWSEIAQDCSDADIDIDLPLPGLYEYAGYFINTLGGQSYLFRRKHYLRILIRYYSTLIIDKANSMDANRYGIDIRYIIDSLISEIEGNDVLANRQNYLKTLITLQQKYQTQYGGN
jgi:hypothetical protein